MHFDLLIDAFWNKLVWFYNYTPPWMFLLLNILLNMLP